LGTTEFQLPQTRDNVFLGAWWERQQTNAVRC
jgi:hypothetical protein